MGEIYDQLKKAAKEKGLTITGIEKQLGFARGSLSKIDEHKPSAEKAAKLSELLGVPIDVLTPTVKRKQITAVFHKQNSAFRKNDSAKPKDSSEMPHSSKPVSAYELVGRIPRLKFDSSKIVQSVLDAIDREMEAHPYEFLVDPSPYEMPREEVELLAIRKPAYINTSQSDCRRGCRTLPSGYQDRRGLKLS